MKTWKLMKYLLSLSERQKVLFVNVLLGSIRIYLGLYSDIFTWIKYKLSSENYPMSEYNRSQLPPVF